MKKLFLLTLAALSSLPFFASKVYQNVWGGSLELTGDEFQPRHESLFAEGQTLRFTFDRQEYGWMQVYRKDCSKSDWPGTDIISGKDLSAGQVEVVLTSTDAEQIRNCGGLYIKGDKITLKSIDLIYSTDDESEWEAVTVWEGNLTSGLNELSAETTLQACDFTAAKVGHKIRFHFSQNEGAEYFQMNVCTKNSTWATSHAYMSYESVTAPTADITLVKDGFADLQERGLYFQGKNITITKAELLQPKWIAVSTWTGSVSSDEVGIPESYFAKAVAGNKLRFHFTNADGEYHQLTASTKDADYDQYTYFMHYGTVTVPTHDIVLQDGDQLNDLRARGLFVSGNNIIISKIELLREDIALGLIDDTDPTALLKQFKGNIVDVTVNRTLYRDGYFNTLCLPFDLSAAQIAESDLEDAEIMAFTNAQINGSGDDQTLELRFDATNAIEAGTPYLVRFADSDDPLQTQSFSGVTVTKDPSDAETVVEGNSMNFVGILAPKALSSTNNLFLGGENTLYWQNAGDDTSLQGFRAYFVIPGTGGPRGIRARIVTKDQSVTGINDIPCKESSAAKYIKNGQLIIIRDGKTYDAQGQRIQY